MGIITLYDVRVLNKGAFLGKPFEKLRLDLQENIKV